jgi:hypothetical protein
MDIFKLLQNIHGKSMKSLLCHGIELRCSSKDGRVVNITLTKL